MAIQVKPSTDNWLKIAAKDLKMAKVSLRENEPLSVIYHLHASIEKILKGIAEENGIVPPKIHSLKKIAVDTCQIQLEEFQTDLMNTLDKAFIDSRYPEDLIEFEEEYNLTRCEDLISRVEVTFKWLKSLIVKN
jgi:HEPN domain-containing protein